MFYGIPILIVYTRVIGVYDEEECREHTALRCTGVDGEQGEVTVGCFYVLGSVR